MCCSRRRLLSKGSAVLENQKKKNESCYRVVNYNWTHLAVIQSRWVHMGNPSVQPRVKSMT